MKQVFQSLKTGVSELIDLPYPQIKNYHVVVATEASLISSGTEKMLLSFGKSSWLAKAQQQPDKVKMVWNKIKTDGLLPAIDAVQSKLDQAIPMGYCNVGRVIAVGPHVTQFAVGDRVVSNGAHAELVQVPQTLCCLVPEDVDNDAAAFTVLGAVALQGLRLASPVLGETCLVIGLGMVGLLTVQLLRAAGCTVIATDLDSNRLALATQFGAIALGAQPVSHSQQLTNGEGVDAVLVTTATDSDAPIQLATDVLRKKGRLVLVGTAGLTLNRRDFYEKEISFQVSCAYGAGRYDPAYEGGQDYPLAYVRWTAKRNFAAVLAQMAAGQINPAALISHRFAFADVAAAYDLLDTNTPKLGILLDYQTSSVKKSSYQPQQVLNFSSADRPRGISFIGAGNYASRFLMPAFQAAAAQFQDVACQQGISGVRAQRKFGFARVMTDIAPLLENTHTKAVVIASQHDQHAQLVCDSLRAGKDVFVEKPLCLTLNEQVEIEANLQPEQLLMVGFNRRFAPHILKIKSLIQPLNAPKTIIMQINAPAIPGTHWTQRSEIGGGRLIGEACHFIDLLRHLVGVPITKTSLQALPLLQGVRDCFTIGITFADGSIGTIHYLTNGHHALPKERLDIYCEGKTLQLINFRKLFGYGFSNFNKMHLWRQDKGQAGCVAAFMQAMSRQTAAPISHAEIFEVSEIAIKLQSQLTNDN